MQKKNGAFYASELCNPDKSRVLRNVGWDKKPPKINF